MIIHLEWEIDEKVISSLVFTQFSWAIVPIKLEEMIKIIQSLLILCDKINIGANFWILNRRKSIVHLIFWEISITHECNGTNLLFSAILRVRSMGIKISSIFIRLSEFIFRLVEANKRIDPSDWIMKYFISSSFFLFEILMKLNVLISRNNQTRIQFSLEMALAIHRELHLTIYKE